jgi:zinc transport system substrate-binding protein
MRHLALALLVLACCSKQPDDSPASDPAPAPATVQPGAGPLRIGVTLHPYYSWVANIVAGVPGTEVVAVLPGELDAIVVNGIGHDDFIRDMIQASGNAHLAILEANAETPLVQSAHGDAVNSHTFLSFTNAVQQSRLIARQLGALRPASAEAFAANARAYGERLRAVEGAAAAKLAHAKVQRVVTVHDGYTYLLQELGVELVGVVQPAHGLTPSAKELGDMIELMKRERIRVVLSEEDFPEKLLATLRDATAARVYRISHVAMGAYSPTEFEAVMGQNADTLVQALVTDP